MNGIPQLSLLDELSKMVFADISVFEGFQPEMIKQHVSKGTKFTLILDDLTGKPLITNTSVLYLML